MIKDKLYLLGIVLLVLSSCNTKKQQTGEAASPTPKIILETDMGNDVDLSLIHI